MTTIDLNKPILDLDGNPVQEGMTLGKALAAQLAHSGKGNAIKFMDWALQLHHGKPIEVDDADHTLLLKFLEEGELKVFVKAPIIRAMIEAKDSNKGKST